MYSCTLVFNNGRTYTLTMSEEDLPTFISRINAGNRFVWTDEETDDIICYIDGAAVNLVMVNKLCEGDDC